jgi:hypothetical protein
MTSASRRSATAHQSAATISFPIPFLAIHRWRVTDKIVLHMQHDFVRDAMPGSRGGDGDPATQGSGK